MAKKKEHPIADDGTIIFDPRIYYVGVWYAMLPTFAAIPSDMVILIWREPNDAPTTWRLFYKIRLRRPNKYVPRDKLWYAAIAENVPNENKVLETIEVFKQCGIVPVPYILRCYGDEAEKRMLACPPSWLRDEAS